MSYATVAKPGALGLDVEYFNDKTGQIGVADAGTGPNCGSPVAMQWMLWSLGFYEGPIDGNVNPETRAALVAFGLSKGIVYNPQTTPSGQICQALIDDYVAWESLPPEAAPGQCPPGQWGVPPYCVGEPTPQRPEGAGMCPEGTMGMPPYCVSTPGATPQPPSPQATSCPEGQVGVPPLCYGLPGGVPPVPGGVPGLQVPPVPGIPVPPTAVPPPKPPPPGPVPTPVEPPPMAAPTGWWPQRSSGEQLLIVVSGALIAVALVAGLGGKKKAATYKPNRRRRSRKRRKVKARQNLRRAAPKLKRQPKRLTK